MMTTVPCSRLKLLGRVTGDHMFFLRETLCVVRRTSLSRSPIKKKTERLIAGKRLGDLPVG